MPFAGRNRLSDAKTTFSVTNKKKAPQNHAKQAIKEGEISV